jgi:hypothetical protein
MLSKINRAMANHAYNNTHNPIKKKPASIRLLLCYNVALNY